MKSDVATQKWTHTLDVNEKKKNEQNEKKEYIVPARASKMMMKQSNRTQVSKQTNKQTKKAISLLEIIIRS